jgi:O-antigen/teichoic acid export membrane protein
MKRQLIINGIVNMFGVFWGLGVSFFITPYLVRHLGSEAYGLWVLALSFSLASGYLALLDFGFLTSVVKFVAAHHARNDIPALSQVFSAAMLLYCCMGGVAGLLIVVFVTFFLESTFNIPVEWFSIAQTLLYIFTIQTVLEFPSLVFIATLQGLQRYDLLRLVEFARLSLYVVLVVVFIGRGYGVLALGWIAVVVGIFRLGGLTILLRRTLPALRIRSFTRAVLYGIVRFSAQVFVLRINAVIYNQMDKAIIGIMLVSTLLTDYDIANKIRALLLAAASSISTLMVPAASYLDAQGDDKQIRILFYQGTKYTLVIALPLAIAVLVLAPSLITLWVGAEYVYLAGLVRLAVVYVFWIGLTMTGHNMLIGTGEIKTLLVVQTLATMINLLISLWLTPLLGVAGVMWGTLIGSLLAFVPLMYLLARAFQIRWEELIRSVIVPTYGIAGVFGGVLILAVSLWGQPQTFWQLAWMGTVSGGIYVIGVFTLGTTASERKTLLATLSLKRFANQ